MAACGLWRSLSIKSGVKLGINPILVWLKHKGVSITISDPSLSTISFPIRTPLDITFSKTNFISSKERYSLLLSNVANFPPHVGVALINAHQTWMAVVSLLSEPVWREEIGRQWFFTLYNWQAKKKHFAKDLLSYKKRFVDIYINIYIYSHNCDF